MNSKPKTLNPAKDDAQIPEIFPCSRGGVVIENYHEKDFFKKATHCQRMATLDAAAWPFKNF
jgi:hypothetical protein